MDRLTATGTAWPASSQRRCWASARFSTRSVSRRMMPVPSATGMNSPGGMRPCGRVLPAQQRLQPLDPLAVQGDLGLVVQEQLVVAVERAPQVAEHGEPHRGGGVHLGLEHDRAGLQLLGRVHRDVGVAQQFLGVGAVPRGQRRCRCSPRRRGPRRRRRRAGAGPGGAARPRPPPRRRRPPTAAGRRTRRRPGARPCRRRAGPTGAAGPPGTAACRRRSARGCR